MATSVDNVISMIATTGHHDATTTISVWRERASGFVVIALAVLLLLPVMLTFAVLSLFVARVFGINISSSAPPERKARVAARRVV